MSQVVAAIAVVSGGLALAVTRRPGPALGVLLDLLVAAGLLRLVGDPDWQTIAVTGTVVALRHLISYGLRLGERSLEETPRGAPGPTTRPRPPRDIVGRLLRPAWRR
ncbi:DUF1622 domain-containing protein [Blastococcus sp. MG754426]|nr:DUF1622 domain-containing protein [Blastococcus sp. MG754426]MCF6514008.1 DUF1622 domain-containing protein [Blastococcus sp. MG754427]MCF6737082.1 DUF1622 domain-containing protein [Blastococcus sp. KM273129]